jgi:hypothetical protein
VSENGEEAERSPPFPLSGNACRAGTGLGQRGLDMLHDRFRHLTGLTWDQAVAHINMLFLEAERLNEAAYSLLSQDSLSPEIWAAFSTTKKQAEAKYAQARQEWLRARRILGSVKRASQELADKIVHSSPLKPC